MQNSMIKLRGWLLVTPVCFLFAWQCVAMDLVRGGKPRASQVTFGSSGSDLADSFWN